LSSVSLVSKTYVYKLLSFADRASRFNRVKKNKIDAQLILSIFHQPLHVLVVFKPIIRRYNLYVQQLALIIPFRWLFQSNQDNRQSSKKNNNYQLLYIYGCTSWWWA